jgi:hypothetical protein
MPPEIDATETTPVVEGSPAVETPPTEPALTPEQQIEGYRKRQAGEAAARAVAEQKLAAALAELAPLKASKQSDADKDLSELAATQARLADAEKRATEAEAKAEGRILDARFPKARAEYGEVVDEAKLAKLEALLSDDAVVATPPTPRGNSGAKDVSDKTAPKTGTIDDAIADLRKFPAWS